MESLCIRKVTYVNIFFLRFNSNKHDACICNSIISIKIKQASMISYLLKILKLDKTANVKRYSIIQNDSVIQFDISILSQRALDNDPPELARRTICSRTTKLSLSPSLTIHARCALSFSPCARPPLSTNRRPSSAPPRASDSAYSHHNHKETTSRRARLSFLRKMRHIYKSARY